MKLHIRTNVPNPESVSTRKILEKLLTNTMATQMNLEGGNEKIAFKKTTPE